MQKDEEPIIVEQTFDISIDALWNSITDVTQMRQWYFEDLLSFRPEVGFEAQFNVQNEDRNFQHMWKVTEVVPLKTISYTWKYEEYPGDSVVTFEISQQDEMTKLRVTHEVLESFPLDIPEFKRESGLAGWKYFIQESLKKFLDS